STSTILARWARTKILVTRTIRNFSVSIFKAVGVHFLGAHAIVIDTITSAVSITDYVAGRSPVPADNRTLNYEGHDGTADKNFMPAETDKNTVVGVVKNTVVGVEENAHGASTSVERCHDTAPKADEETNEKADEKVDDKVGAGFVLVDFRDDDDGVKEVDAENEVKPKSMGRGVEYYEPSGSATRAGEWYENKASVGADDVVAVDDVNDAAGAVDAKPVEEASGNKAEKSKKFKKSEGSRRRMRNAESQR
ncbi:hypothetical protein MTO96_038537, partial [Rhipicephalus appendiculatus]